MLDNPISNKPAYLALWVTLLLKANHLDKKIMWNGDILVIKDGQLVTGRKELSKQTDIPESTVEDILNYLEKQQQIQQQKNTKFRIITIINWKTHQISDNSSDNKATTKQQQADTNKNDKNDKNIEFANANIVSPEDLTYEPLVGDKSKGAFLNRARAKKRKPPMLNKNPEVMRIIQFYQAQYKFITGQRAIVTDADYFHVLSITKKLSPQEMEKMIIWYVKLENKKFQQHPGLKSIFTPENVMKFGLNG